MNHDFNTEKNNNYEGNGWSRYQIMVLQQLDDHNTVLQNLNKEVVEIKQSIAVNDTESKIWRTTAMNQIKDLETKMSSILYDEKGISSKVSTLERNMHAEEYSSKKIKALWALYGAIVSFILTFGLQLLNFLLKTK